MSPPYSYVVSDDVLKGFTALRGADRSEWFRIFEALADNPFLQADRTRHDANGRPLSVKRFRQWEVTYWCDHAAREVRIGTMTRITAA